MKKVTTFWMMLMAVVLGMGFVSCSDAEDGEDWDTWVMRNLLDSGWSLNSVVVDGEYRTMGERDFDFYFEMNLRATGRKFEAHRFFYKDGMADESTEVFKSGTFVVDGGKKTIECTDSDGSKVFRLSDIDFGTGTMEATLTFYDLNQTYTVVLGRSTYIKMK